VRTVKPTVEGEDFDTWYAKQHILNTHHTSGYKLIMKADSSTVYYFYRSATGLDTMQAGKTLNWSVYDYDNILIDSGSKATSDYGWIDIYPEVPSGYRGRIKIVVTVDTPEGEISRAFFNSYGVDETGVFGIVNNQTEGEIVITPLDDPSLQESTEVINGAFSIPSLRNIRGQFSLVYTDFNNRQIERIFTKDASSYYTSVGCLLPPVLLNIKLIPDSAFSSHLIPLPLFLLIAGSDTNFNSETTVSFSGDMITPPWTVALSTDLIFIFSMTNPVGMDASGNFEVEVTVSTAAEEGTETLTLTILP
jgi:hypothetical protein